jgi:hypothetical protein
VGGDQPTSRLPGRAAAPRSSAHLRRTTRSPAAPGRLPDDHVGRRRAHEDSREDEAADRRVDKRHEPRALLGMKTASRTGATASVSAVVNRIAVSRSVCARAVHPAGGTSARAPSSAWMARSFRRVPARQASADAGTSRLRQRSGAATQLQSRPSRSHRAQLRSRGVR